MKNMYYPIISICYSSFTTDEKGLIELTVKRSPGMGFGGMMGLVPRSFDDFDLHPLGRVHATSVMAFPSWIELGN